MDIELNIRLDVRGRRNSTHDCTTRAYQAIDRLCQKFRTVRIRRHAYQYEDEQSDQLLLADCLVVRIEGITFEQRYLYREVIHQLATELEQDCIAVYFPFTHQGELIGSRPGDYGQFDYNLFHRFL